MVILENFLSMFVIFIIFGIKKIRPIYLTRRFISKSQAKTAIRLSNNYRFVRYQHGNIHNIFQNVNLNWVKYYFVKSSEIPGLIYEFSA